VVINHSGDNWSYPGGFTYNYSNDQQFPFGFWRRDDRPIPTELRNENYYHRRGNMADYDTYPENQHGDLSGLKDYANVDTAIRTTDHCEMYSKVWQGQRACLIAWKRSVNAR